LKQETTFAHTKFANPFMNASGVHCMTIEDLQELEKSDAGAYITKSCTLEKREGNPSPRYVDLALGSINSMGLPNLGFNYYLDYVLEVQKNQDTPIFFSIAGMSPEENLEMLDSITKKRIFRHY
jgi:dihydroorotate oxidase B, catalytic subunit (EC 1.3.3.1)